MRHLRQRVKPSFGKDLQHGSYRAAALQEPGFPMSFDKILFIYRSHAMENAVKNVDVKVTVDVRVDPLGVAVFLTSVAAALFFLKNKAKAVSQVAA